MRFCTSVVGVLVDPTLAHAVCTDGGLSELVEGTEEPTTKYVGAVDFALPATSFSSYLL